MPLRPVTFAPNEHYHLCVRGNNKQPIFRTHTDRARLLFLLLHFQSPENIDHISRILRTHTRIGEWKIDPDLRDTIIDTRYVTLEAFCFMSNHFHLQIREEEENGVVRYMQRVLNAYAKYFNLKYERVGHLFQGPFRAVHVEDNDQLLYLSTYIHRNPREIKGLAGKEDQYEWSSYQDYLGKNRFPGLLDSSLVLEQFDSSKDYRAFVNSSVAKEHAQTLELL